MVINVPQIRCPNCGRSINLENRRETDFSMILNALKNRERSFTELLHITKLPRKTLSLRLKDLQEKGIIVKNGAYYLNGAHPLMHGGGRMEKYSELLLRRKVVLALLLLAVGLPATSTVLASLLLSSPPPNQQPQIKGTFTATIEVYDAKDVYSWQAKIIYDSSKLKIIEILPGDFLGITNWPFFINATDVEEGMALLFGTLYGEVPGRDGSGQLAVIVFGYYSRDFEEPEIVFDGNTWLLNSNLQKIPVNEDVLMLKVAELP